MPWAAFGANPPPPPGRRRARRPTRRWRSTASAARRAGCAPPWGWCRNCCRRRRCTRRAGHPVDAKAPAGVVMAQRAPQPRRLDEQLDPGLALERMVIGGGPGSGRRHRRCPRRCGRRPSPPASRCEHSCPVDRPPREGRALKPRSWGGPVARQSQGHVTSRASASRAAWRRGVGQDGRAEDPCPRRCARRDSQGPVRPLAAIARRSDLARRLEGVKEREAHRLLKLGVAFELDIGGVPEVV